MKTLASGVETVLMTDLSLRDSTAWTAALFFFLIQADLYVL